MENHSNENIDYSFLLEEDVQRSFADLHTCLLSGKHICFTDDYTFYSILEMYESHWKFFYRNLYGLNLADDIFDKQFYYYLDFFDSDKGALSNPSRSRQLTELQTIIGLVLLDMYYHRYFNEQKIIYWIDIKMLIEDSEFREQYQNLLFKAIRPSYTEQEWSRVERIFNETITSFAKLGWVSKISGQGEELIFEIKPAIFRMAKIYEQELSDLDALVEKLNNTTTI